MRKILAMMLVGVAGLFLAPTDAKAQATHGQATAAIDFATTYYNETDTQYATERGRLEAQLQRYQWYYELAPLCYNSMTPSEQALCDALVTGIWNSMDLTDSALDEALDQINQGYDYLSTAESVFGPIGGWDLEVQLAELAAKDVNPPTGEFPDARANIDAARYEITNEIVIQNDMLEMLLRMYLIPWPSP